MSAVRMADSVDPAEIPQLFERNPNGVAAYIDGQYQWPRHELHRFPRMWRITVTGSPAAVPRARVVDVETEDVSPARVLSYESERAALGETTIAYCSRDTVPLIVAAGNNWPNLHWWIATLDGLAWTPESLAGWIRAQLGVTLEPAKIRAVQNMPMGHYDQSAVFGDPGWARG